MSTTYIVHSNGETKSIDITYYPASLCLQIRIIGDDYTENDIQIYQSAFSSNLKDIPTMLKEGLEQIKEVK
jgi:hypothetical protein